MNIRRENDKLTISAWDQKDPINRTFFSGLFFLLIYFIFGFQSGLIGLGVLFFIYLAMHFKTCQSNNESAIFDFDSNQVILEKSFLGFKVNEDQLQNVHFNQLVFKEYQRNYFGQKKYQLEYSTEKETVVLYRLDNLEQKTILEKELNQGL